MDRDRKASLAEEHSLDLNTSSAARNTPIRPLTAAYKAARSDHEVRIINLQTYLSCCITASTWSCSVFFSNVLMTCWIASLFLCLLCSTSFNIKITKYFKTKILCSASVILWFCNLSNFLLMLVWMINFIVLNFRLSRITRPHKKIPHL